MLLAALAPGGDATSAIARQAAAIRTALLARWDIADIADATLAASGTDAALLLTGLLCGGQTATTILLSPAETGSGVPQAARGRHFAAFAADGRPVPTGHAVDGFAPIAMLAVPLREADGAPRPLASIAAGCAAAIEAACVTGGRAVLHAIDGSKTGLSAPGLNRLIALKARYGERLDIIVDACQARLPPARLRRYLEQGWPVMLTGSKFFGGPGFSGALLMPRSRIGALSLPPAGLAAYAALPSVGTPQNLPGRANAGLVLRWQAALSQMRRFDHQSGPGFSRTLDRLAAAADRLIEADPDLLAIAATPPDAARADDGADDQDWTRRRTVITFAVREAARLASVERLARIHLLLNQNLAASLPDADQALAATPCQIGQPVLLGTQDGQAFGGLRIAFGASHADPGIDHEAQLATVFRKLRLVIAADELR